MRLKGVEKAMQTDSTGLNKGKSFYAIHWNPWIWLTALSMIDDGAGPPLYDVGTQTEGNFVTVMMRDDARVYCMLLGLGLRFGLHLQLDGAFLA